MFKIRALAFALFAMPLAAAAAYPEKAVKLVVPYPPGGSADIAARLITDEWGKALGGTLFIENKAGAGGNIEVDAVAKALPANNLKELVALLKSKPGRITAE